MVCNKFLWFVIMKNQLILTDWLAKHFEMIKKVNI